MQSKAATVDAYLAELPPERREAIRVVRAAILKNLNTNYEEGMQYGMIGYYVPHSLFPAGYHCDPAQPLPFAALASQKNHMALYLMGLSDADERRLRAGFDKAGKKLDMGKCCIRFKALDHVPLNVISEVIGRIPAKIRIARYEQARKEAGEATARKPRRSPTSSRSKPSSRRKARAR